MAGNYLNFVFDEELFLDAWAAAPDPVKTALIDSGAMVVDPVIAEQLQQKGNIYSVPFFNVLSGDPVNYDGQTDITSTEASSVAQVGVAYGRAKGFTARDFVAELSGSDPMGHIVSSVSKYWAKQRQKILIGELEAIFGITSDPDWAKHTVDLSKESGTAYKIEATTINDAATQVLGDNKGAFGLAVMHSNVAATLEKLQVLEFWKYTDANGMTRQMNLANVNGLIAVIDDSVPVDTSVEGFPKYTSYILGNGVLRTAPGRVDKPVEVERDAAKNGGQDTLYTRIRETIHPNGFSFITPAENWTQSPTDAQLFDSVNWKRIFDARAIPMAKVVTNG